jgi:hypothetical protein
MAKPNLMARGLSKLQKTMLQISWVGGMPTKFEGVACNCWGSRETEEGDEVDHVVHLNNIFMAVYGWVINDKTRHFNKNKIGLKPYMAAKIAVHKATQRLVKRGLINRKDEYYWLTPEGEALMAKLDSDLKALPDSNG